MPHSQLVDCSVSDIWYPWTPRFPKFVFVFVFVVMCTAPKWVPIWGPFSVFGSPLGPHRVPLGPHFLFLRFRTRKKSECSHHLMSIIWLLVITQTTFNESHASSSVKVSFRKKLIISTNYLILVNLSNIHCLGPHFCCWGSPLGPHFARNWVPIGSPWKIF